MSLRRIPISRISTLRNIQKRCLSTASPQAKKEPNKEEDVRIKPAPAEPWKRPKGMVSSPYTRNTKPYRHKAGGIVEEFVNEGDATGMGARLTDYYRMQDYVLKLKTPAERIDFVNPYERPWNRVEKKWHRPQHPLLTQPRRAWSLPSVPQYFDTLDFYKYITKTRVVTDVKPFSDYYKDLVPPTASLERRMTEALLSTFNGTATDDEELVNEFLRGTLLDAEQSIAHNNDNLRKHRFSTNDRCESFWIRGGFLGMYEQKPIWDDYGEISKDASKGPRFIGDDKRRLGEVVFTMRDKLAAQIRAKTKLPVVAPFSQKEFIEAPLFEKDIDVKKDVIFSPLQFNIFSDTEPLWQCPGYEPDSEEPFKFGRLAIKNVSELKKKLDLWKIPPGDEYDTTFQEAFASIAVSSLFNWLNGQAHCLGHTCYNDIKSPDDIKYLDDTKDSNDIKEPLVSQMILSDGQSFAFAIAQLNTIALNVEMEGFVNRRSNICLVDGPYNLYDEYDSDTKQYKHLDANGQMVSGLNKHVLSRYLQMIMIGREV